MKLNGKYGRSKFIKLESWCSVMTKVITIATYGSDVKSTTRKDIGIASMPRHVGK
jgi:hypothetical protein